MNSRLVFTSHPGVFSWCALFAAFVGPRIYCTSIPGAELFLVAVISQMLMAKHKDAQPGEKHDACGP